MATEFRVLTEADLERAIYVEGIVFYQRRSPEFMEFMKSMISPDWLVGAFVDGELVATVRTVPMVRRLNGAAMAFGAVGPVACLAAYRRQGLVAQLFKLALAQMRERRQTLSGLHTPHDALYARFGYERAEGRRHYEFRPKDIVLRQSGPAGRLEQVGADDWQRLHGIYKRHADCANGAFERNELWWREVVFRHWDDSGARPENDACVWIGESGEDEGYIIYWARVIGHERWPIWGITVRELVPLTADAYTALHRHLLTHDIARRVEMDVPPDDPLPMLLDDPFRIEIMRLFGAMLRIVDVEQALALRPYTAERPVSFTMGIEDRHAPWNNGTWQVEAAEGKMRAERTDGPADVELPVGFLAPLFSGHIRPEVAASTGMLRVNRPEALREMTDAFAVLKPPFCFDNY